MSRREDTNSLLRFGAFEADLKSGELRKNGKKIKLQDQPFRILHLLLLQPGGVVTREEIHKNLWGDDTFVDFERGLNKAIYRLRAALGDSAESPRFIETLPKKGYRFVASVEATAGAQDRPLHVPSTSRPAVVPESRRAVLKSVTRFRSAFPTILLLVVAGVGIIFFLHQSRSAARPEGDTVVLAEIENRTNDSAFDDTLKQALSIDLEQSPFLKILSDQQVADTLRLMLRSPDKHLTRDLARSVCRRTGSKAVVGGAISSLGSQYVIDLEAIGCESGEVLAREQIRANRREDVLAAMDASATEMRRKLGESLPSIQKYSKPIHEALSTASLDAFQAYANGERVVQREGNLAAIPFDRRAIELDPNFAYAYAALGLLYGVWGETTLSAENTKKAYALQDRVTEWEKFFISVQYHFRVTRDIEEALKAGRMWIQVYPRERTAHNRLASAYALLGNRKQAAAELEQARVLGGENPIDVTDLSKAYISLGKLKEAKAILQEAVQRSPHRLSFRQQMYLLAFVQDDPKLLQEQVDWAAHEDGALLMLGHSDTEAYSGRLAKARELSRLGEDYALRNGFAERAAFLRAAAAFREAQFGYSKTAVEQARNALEGNPGTDVQVLAALALAQNDVSRARDIADRLNREFPSATLIQNYWLPTIRAEIEIASANPGKAIEFLRKAESYELSSESSMIPVYVRGKAYLAAQQGQAAAIEFKTILQHPGIVGNNPIGALALASLAKALAMSGNTSVARATYQQFFTLWKDADPDVPILKEARSDFTRLTALSNNQR